MVMMVMLMLINNCCAESNTAAGLTVHTGGSGSPGTSNLSLPAGAAGSLPGNGPTGLAAVMVHSDNFTGSCCRLT